jgi:hypothetical protein
MLDDYSRRMNGAEQLGNLVLFCIAGIVVWTCTIALGVAQVIVECGDTEDGPGATADWSLAPVIELNDNGAWSWFSDERVIIHDGDLIVGSVRSLGDFHHTLCQAGWGNVEIAIYDLESGIRETVVFHEEFEQDDHDNPAFLPVEGGGLLAVYTKHARERMVYWRHSVPGDPSSWSEAGTFTTPGGDSDYGGHNVTYSNLFRWPDGRIYNFHRGYDQDPNYMFSDDEGRTWTYGGRLLEGLDGYSPYLEYAHDGTGRIHFIATEDHPRNYDNGIWHGYLENGVVHHSDGAPIAELSETSDANLAVWDLSLVFPGDPGQVAWVIDLELDGAGRPHAVFSVQRDGAGLRPGQGGFDIRYHYGWWDGERWTTEEIAYAGTRLYAGEDDYSGLAALHPRNPKTVYISTNADPITGEALISTADGERHHELFWANRDTGWAWQPLTANSSVDNLRPIIPKWDDERTALVWMRGGYYDNHGEWDTAVVAMILDRVL